MKKEYRQALLVGSVAALLSAPGWAAEEQPALPGSEDPKQSEPTQVEEAAPAQATEPQPQPSEPQTSFASPEALKLYNHSPNELTGRDVIGSDGAVLGRISDIVAGRASGRIYAVVSRGGFLGIGSTDYAVQLDELSLDQDKLRMEISAPELEMRREYEGERYVAVTPVDSPISEFSAFEAEPQPESDEAAPAPQSDEIAPQPQSE